MKVDVGVYNNTLEAEESLGNKTVSMAVVPGLVSAHILVPRTAQAVPSLPNNLQSSRLNPLSASNFAEYAILLTPVDSLVQALKVSNKFNIVEDKRPAVARQ